MLAAAAGLAPSAIAQVAGCTLWTDEAVYTCAVPPGWALEPPSDMAGIDNILTTPRFRLLFATSGSAPGSWTSLDPYNRFVRAHATGTRATVNTITVNASPHTSITPFGGLFSALVSVDADNDAQANAGISTNEQGGGERANVFWLGGGKLAQNNQDLLDGTWIREMRGHWRQERGTSVGFGTTLQPVTGSTHAGEVSQVGNTSYALGSGGHVMRGYFDNNENVRVEGTNRASSSRGPLEGWTLGDATRGRVLAISPLFRIVDYDIALTIENDGSSVSTVDEDIGQLAIRATLMVDAAAVPNRLSRSLRIPIVRDSPNSAATPCADKTMADAKTCDYLLAASEIVIPAGRSSGQISLDIVDDDAFEPDEVLAIVVGDVSGDVALDNGTKAGAQVTIESDDTFPVAVHVAEPDAEGQPARFVLYTAEEFPGSSLTVRADVTERNLQFAAGTFHHDYIDAGDETDPSDSTDYKMIAIAKTPSPTDDCGMQLGTITHRHCVTYSVATADDNVDEPPGRVDLTIIAVQVPGQAGQFQSVKRTSTQSYFIKDNDPTEVTLVSVDGRNEVLENGSTDLRIGIGRPLAGSETLTIPLAIGGDAARGSGEDDDYTLVCAEPGQSGVRCSTDLGGADTALVKPGVSVSGFSDSNGRVATATAVDLTLAAVADRLDEDDEVEIGFGAVKYTSSPQESGTGIALTPMSGESITISIVDQTPNTATLRIAGVGASGEGSAVDVTVTLASANETGAPIGIPVRARACSPDTRDACTTAGREDFTLGAATVSIPPAETSVTVAATLRLLDDDDDEPDEVVAIEIIEADLPAVGGVVVTASSGHDVLVIADDDPTAVTLKTPDTLAEEGERDVAAIVVELGRPLGWTLSRKLDTARGPTVMRTPETLEVPLSLTGAAVDADSDDLLDDGDYTLGLADREGATEGVTFDADSPGVTFGIAADCDTSAAEPCETAASAVVELKGAQDFDIDDETVVVALGTLVPSGLDGGLDASRDGPGRIVIVDDDESRVSFETDGPDTAIGEDRADSGHANFPATATIDLRLRPLPTEDIEIGFVVTGRGEPGVDFVVRAASVARNPANPREGNLVVGNTGTLAVPARDPDYEYDHENPDEVALVVEVLDDDVAERDETVEITLFPEQGYMLDDSAGFDIYTHSFTIGDDDEAGVDVADLARKAFDAPLELDEGGDPVCYLVRLESDPVDTVTIVPRSTDRGAARVEVLDGIPADAEACGAQAAAQPADRMTFSGGGGGDWNDWQAVRAAPQDDGDGNDETFEIGHNVLGYLDGGGAAVTADAIAIRVRDAQPTVCFSASGGAVDIDADGACVPSSVALSAREGAMAAVTIWLGSRTGREIDRDAALTLNYNVSGSASGGDDYAIEAAGAATGTFDAVAGGGTIDVPPGADAVTLVFEIRDDAVAEDSEEIIVSLTPGAGYALGGSAATLDIVDNDEPALTVTPVSATDRAAMPRPLQVREGDGRVCYEVRLATDPGPTTVSVEPESSNTAAALVAGIGAADCDDSNAQTTTRLVFTGGGDGNWQTPQRIRVVPVGDADSADEAVTVRHFVRGYDGVEDVPEVRVEVIDFVSVDFGADAESSALECRMAGGVCAANVVNLRIGLSRPSAADEDIRIAYTVFGSATPGADYTIAGLVGEEGVVRAVPGADEVAIPVEILDDSIVEGAEQLIVALAEPTGIPEDSTFHYVGDSNIHVLTIEDDDDGPGVTVTPTTLTLREGGANEVYTVALDTDPEGEVAVLLGSGNLDSVTVSTVTLLFTSDNWDVPQTVVVSALDDSDGADERATIVHDVDGYPGVTAAPSVEVAVIDDDDDLADTVVSVVAVGEAIAEGGLAEFRISATPVPEDVLTVNVTVAGDGDFARDGQSGSRPVTIGADGTATLTVATVDDAADEPDGTIRVTLEPGRGYTVATAPSDAAALAVADDDAPREIPLASFEATGATLAEADGIHELAVVVNPPPEASIALNYTLGGTATPGADFVIDGVNEAGEGAIAVAAGATRAAIAVTIVGDSLVEGEETLTLTLADGRGYEVGAARVYMLTLLDDDNAGLSISPLSIEIEEGGANRVYAVRLNTDPGGTATVTPSLDDPGAAAISGALTFTSRNWRTPQEIVVAALDDADADHETVSISHRVSGYPGIVSGPEVVVNVVDDDVDFGDPEVSIAAGGAIGEGGIATFTLTADPPPRFPVNVNVTVADGGGFAAVGQAGSRPVRVGVGGTATLTVATADDLDEEADGELTATLGAGEGYVVADWPANVASVAVADDDGPPVMPEVSIVQTEASIGESGGPLVVILRIDPAVDRALALDYSLSGTAAPGDDYSVRAVGARDGTVEAPAGAATVEIEFTIVDDEVNEPPETVLLTVLSGSGYTVAGGAFALTIADNDAAAGVRVQAAPALARLGRSLSEQLIDGVRGRLAARPSATDDGPPGAAAFKATFWGRDDWFDPDADWRKAASGDIGEAGPAARSGAGFGPSFDAAGRASPPGAGPGRDSVGFDDLLRGALASSSFQNGGPLVGGGQLGFWGRGASTQLAGGAGDFSLDGEMTSAQLGVDWTGVWLTAGLMVSQGDGSGQYRQGGVDGDVELSLSSIVPYFGYRLGERASLWAALATSVGDLELAPQGAGPTVMDLSMRAVALGGRGEMYAGEGGFSLSVVADLFAVDAETEAMEGLPDVESGSGRLRLAAEGTWMRELSGGGRLANRTEAGLRSDSGDAEEGVGVELVNGTSLRRGGFVAELEMRTLLLHADEQFSQDGFALYLAWDPSPESALGPMLSLNRGWGVDTASGVSRLHGMADLAGFGASDDGARMDVTLGWGFLSRRGSYLLTPGASYGARGGAREMGLALVLAPAKHNSIDLSASLGTVWRSATGSAPGERGIELQVRVRW